MRLSFVHFNTIADPFAVSVIVHINMDHSDSVVICIFLLQVRYNHYGELNQAKDNVMVVCHALTGNSQLSTWWSSMLGPGKAFDTSKYFIICANVLGSCYGTTGPLSINPSTGKRYGASFPKVNGLISSLHRLA